MRFIKENTVFGYKKWWKTISISFPKSSEAIHITFSTNLYRVHWQGGFTLDGSLFWTIFSGSHEKKRKYSFKLQKRVKIQKKYYFWKLWRLIISRFRPYFWRQVTLKGSTAKSIFFFSVLCIKAEKTQNTFFGYKKWSKFESDDIFRSATQILYIFHFYISLKRSASYL